MLIEILGTLLSLAYLYCSVTQRSALWLLGFASSALYIVVYYESKFYADMTLQVYYLVVSVYGLWHWKWGKQVRSTQAELPVTRTPGRTWAGVTAMGVLLFVAYWMLLRRTDAALPVGDSFTTALSIVATWMLARKYIEYWLIFIVVDAVSAIQYIYKGLYPTAVLFTVYTVMAVVGYRQWRKTMMPKSGKMMQISGNVREA